jgi:uncharacterized membrane protein
MRQFTISAAMATVFAALLVAVPAQADAIHGGPIKNGTQCFKFAASYERDARWGNWSACPQTASVAAAPRQLRRSRSASR